jgi:CheY-like chemotaxis protein
MSTVDVLLIEDNELDAKLFKLLLEESLGLRVNFTKDPLQAFEWLKHVKPRLIHTDVMMPGISGMEVVARLKASPETKDIPVIVATAGAFVWARNGSSFPGIEAFFAKPISATQYTDCVRAILDQKK